MPSKQDENLQRYRSYDVDKIFKTKQQVCVHVLACAASEKLSRTALDDSSASNTECSHLTY